MLTDNSLKSKVDALWNRFWSGGISNPLTAIEQMSYLIFLKHLQDIDNAKAQSFLSLGNNIRIIIPLPPLPLQKKFGSLVEQVEQLRVKQRESEKELENLFGSLMQRYFGG